MFNRKKDFSAKLYSDTVPPGRRSSVLAIASGDYDRLQSRAFSLIDKDFAEEWLEAWKIKGQDFWSVERHNILKAGDETLHQKTTLRSSLCFFDALSYVAQYEQFRVFNGNPDSQRPCVLPYYKDVARTLGMPEDIDGQLHPAADGRTLTDGTFTEKQLALAQISAAVVPVKSAGLIDHWPRFASATDIVPVQNEIVSQALAQNWVSYRQGKEQLANLKERFHRAQSLSHAMLKGLDEEILRGFSMTVLGKIAHALDISLRVIFPPLLIVDVGDYAYGGDGDTSSVRLKARIILPRQVKILRNLSANLPHSQTRSCLAAFAGAAMPTFYLEKAVAIYGLCRDGKIDGSRLLQGIKNIELAGASSEWSEEEIEHLKAEYRAGRVPAPKTFLNTLRNLCIKFEISKDQEIAEYEKQLEAMKVSAP